MTDTEYNELWRKIDTQICRNSIKGIYVTKIEIDDPKLAEQLISDLDCCPSPPTGRYDPKTKILSIFYKPIKHDEMW